jgi:UDP-2,3-diacylglucosamine hydrolase
VKTFFAADLHLVPGKEPGQNRRLRRFLLERCAGAETLYLLGDVFQCWFERGGTRHVGDYAEVLSIFRAAHEKGLRMHMVPGNRDFILGRRLRERSGIIPHGEVLAARVRGRVLLLTHGDLFCTDDIGYRAMRHLFMGWPGRWLWRLVPWTIARRVAGRIQSRRRSLVDAPPREGTDISTAAAEKFLRRHRAEAIVCGHIHHAGIRKLLTKERTGELVVLPPWGAAGGYGTFDGERFRLHEGEG